MADTSYEKRSETRRIIDAYSSLESLLRECSLIYQFKVWNISTKDIRLLVSEGGLRSTK